MFVECTFDFALINWYYVVFFSFISECRCACECFIWLQMMNKETTRDSAEIWNFKCTHLVDIHWLIDPTTENRSKPNTGALTIGAFAFECKKIKRLEIKNTVTSRGKNGSVGWKILLFLSYFFSLRFVDLCARDFFSLSYLRPLIHFCVIVQF